MAGGSLAHYLNVPSRLPVWAKGLLVQVGWPGAPCGREHQDEQKGRLGDSASWAQPHSGLVLTVTMKHHENQAGVGGHQGRAVSNLFWRLTCPAALVPWIPWHFLAEHPAGKMPSARCSYNVCRLDLGPMGTWV